MTKQQVCETDGRPDRVTTLSGGREEWFYAEPQETILFSGDRLLADVPGSTVYRGDVAVLLGFARERRLTVNQRVSLLALAAAVAGDPTAKPGSEPDLPTSPDRPVRTQSGRLIDPVCLTGLAIVGELSEGPGPPPFASAPVAAAARRAGRLLYPACP